MIKVDFIIDGLIKINSILRIRIYKVSHCLLVQSIVFALFLIVSDVIIGICCWDVLKWLIHFNLVCWRMIKLGYFSQYRWDYRRVNKFQIIRILLWFLSWRRTCICISTLTLLFHIYLFNYYYKTLIFTSWGFWWNAISLLGFRFPGKSIWVVSTAI